MKDVVLLISFDLNWQFLCGCKGWLVRKWQKSDLVQCIRRIGNKFSQENLKEKKDNFNLWLLPGIFLFLIKNNAKNKLTSSNGGTKINEIIKKSTTNFLVTVFSITVWIKLVFLPFKISKSAHLKIKLHVQVGLKTNFEWWPMKLTGQRNLSLFRTQH